MTSIKDRILAALAANGGAMSYYDLARAVFPADRYPRAWGRPNRGGPPGCYMALSRAIEKYGFSQSFDGAPMVCATTIGFGKNRPVTNPLHQRPFD